jgi:uncharacterized RmlC-like cupin family protein
MKTSRILAAALLVVGSGLALQAAKAQQAGLHRTDLLQHDLGQPVTLHAGDALFIPAGAAHLAKNVGNGKASELATYIVEKGSPLVVPVK